MRNRIGRSTSEPAAFKRTEVARRSAGASMPSVLVSRLDTSRMHPLGRVSPRSLSKNRFKARDAICLVVSR